MRQTNVRGTLSLRGFRKLRTGAIVATGVILLGLGFLAPTVSANEQDGVWLARTVAEVKADIQNIDNLSYYTIKWGDTLSAISGATGLSVDSLVEINRIANRDLIFANNKLYFSEEAFLKDGNTEVKRQRVSIDNSGSCQSYEVETKTNTVTGEQRTTVKQTTPVVVETPAVSAAKAEESVSPAPKVEEPVTPAPKVEESVTPAPKVEEPASSAPKVEEPVTPAPKVEEPASTTPKAEESASPAPKADEPSATTPKVEEPATPAPKVEEPTTPAPKAEEPSATTPKAEEPAKSAPKAEEPATPAPKSEAEPATPAPKADEPASTTPKAEEPAAPALKDDESGSSVESPSTGNHSDESGAPSTTPTGDSTATQPSDSTSSPVTPSEEAPVTSGDANSTTQPAGESGSSETTSEPSNTPSAEATNDSGNAATSTPTPEASTSEPKSEEELKKEEALKSAKKESIDDNIGEVVKIKADAIEKVTDADEKARLKEALKALQDKAIEEINKAKDDEEVATVTEKYQNEINALDVPGEEVSSPNYGKEGLTNNGPGGTTIDNGSTAIGHGASGTSRSAVASPSESSTQPSSTSEGASSFRNAPSVQARARRVARSTSEPDGTVNISYNFAGMPDIHGFLSDPGENNTVTIPAGTSEAQAKELVKEKIQAKIKDLAARGYHVKNDIIFEQDTTVKNYNYVVTFTKETTGTSGFRMAPAVQPRASRNRRSLEQPAPQKVKVNVFYNFDQMKDIAGFLGDINGTSLEIAEGLSNEQVKAAVESQVDTKKEELSKRGYTFKEDYVYQSNGKDYNYVVTFSKAAK
ncbi:MAG: LysM peptidoglycan-binding domain-containing protein [Streptococcus mitis]|nr:LysM peptidoglycan-binding domain-containing protein [Streptococcus mitis]